MANQTFKLTFDADLKINQLKQSVAAFQQALNGLKMPDKLLSPFTKDLAKLESEIKNFTMLTSKTDFDKSDVNAIVKSYKTIDKLTKSIGITNKELASTNLMNLLPPEALKRFEQLQSILDQINSVDLAKNELANQIADATSKAKDLEDQVRDTEKALNDLRTKQKDNQLNKINATTNRENIEKEIDRLKKANEELVNSRSNNPNVIAANKKIIDDNRKAIQGLLKDIDLLQKTMATQKARAVEAGKSVPAAYYENERKVNREQSDVTRLEAENARLEKENRSMSSQKTDATQLKEYKQREQQIQSLTGKLADAKIAESEYGAAIRKTASDITNTTNTLDKQKQALADVNATIAELQTKDIEASKLQELRQALADILQQDISTIPDNLDDLKNTVSQLQDEPLQKVRDALKQFAQASADASDASGKLRKDVDDGKESFDNFDKEASDVDALKKRIQYFFGLSNAVNLVKRAIRSAFETIKELDKAMTETAVVTDFSVGDMWKQLPEYTKRANELGVSTLAAYQAATLYYQQGLKTEEVNALSVETLKMARIAGLEAAEATDRMTNALRGFNMALTEVNAQRVDDVYSELAANTASNVDEISTAMTKVASLAHNANMEFETTAAFLSQIIETTRESAETAGTALKTVVARFSEVKKLVDMDQLQGQDEEGQVIDVNRVGQALRTAGIDLNKYFIGEVGLDDIFMELASKWDSLTSVQQRYIATQAAGSRQQSRFIALMSDYARTQELVGKAYNSNGAAAKQFAKTQESLESKLARLKNAWNEFLMGLTNNQMVKTFVDILTTILNIVNSITSAFGDGIGTILKWTAAIGGIKLGKSIFKSVGFDSILSVFTGKNKDGKKISLADALEQLLIKKQQKKTGNGLNAGIQPISEFGKLGEVFKRTKIGHNLSQALNPGTAAAMTKAGGVAAGASGAATLGVALGAVASAAFLAYAAVKGLYNLSPKGQLKIVQDYAKSIKEVHTQAKNSSDELKDIQSQYKEYSASVQSAKSIKSQNEAILERNKYIESIIEKNQDLAKYVVAQQKNGQLELVVNEEQLAAAVKSVAETVVASGFIEGIAQALVYDAEGDVAKAKNKWIGRIGSSIDQFAPFLRQSDLYGSLKSNYISNSNKSQEAQQNAKNTIRNTAITWASQQGYEDNVSNILGDIISQVINTDQYKDLINRRAQGLSKMYDPFDLYKKEFGKDPEGIEKPKGIIRIKQEGEDQLYKDVAASRIYKEQQLPLLTNIGNLLANDNSKAMVAISQAFGNIDTIFEKSLQNIDVTNKDQMSEYFGVTAGELTASIDKLSDAIPDLDTRAITKTIQQNALYAKRLQLEQRVNLARGLRQGQVSTENIQAVLQLEPDQQQIFQQLYKSFDTQFLSDQVTSSLIQGINNSTPEFNQWINSLNLKNPILAFEDLSKAAKSTNQDIANVAKNLMNSGNAANYFSAQNQLAFLVTSEGFNDISTELSKFIDEEQHISSDNIIELAKSNKELQSLLDNNTMSAKALAMALEGIQSGEIGIWDLNDAIIAAINSVDDLDSIVRQTIDDLNGFSVSFDENDITKFIENAYKFINENLENGKYGNQGNKEYLEKIFGPDIFDFGDVSVDEYGNRLIEQQQRLLGILEANQENMYNAWTQVLGTYQTESGETLRIFEDGNEIFIEGAQATTDELIQIVAKASGLGEEWAKLMIGDYKNNSPNFAYKQGLIDFSNRGVDEWYKALKSDNNGNKVYNESDIETLRKLYNVQASDIQNIINNKYGKSLKSYNFNDASGNRTKQSIQDALNSIYGEGAINWGDVLNYDDLKEKYDSLGLSDWFESDFEKLTEDSKKFTASFFGEEPTEVPIEKGQTAGEAYAQAFQQAVNKDLGDQIISSIKTGFEEFDINITADGIEITDKAVKDLTEDVQNAQKASQDGIKVSASESGISTVIENLKQLRQQITLTRIMAALGIHIPVSQDSGGDAAGGIVKSYASGSRSIKPGIALTGEEGPEIVWNKEQGYAYVTGNNGAEFQNLQPGDHVFNAAETSRIFRNSSLANGGYISSFAGGDAARGYGGAPKKKKKGSGGGGSGGSGSDKDDEWKNDLDWLYNVMENIAELERQQNIYQEEYEDLLKDQTKTGQDLYKMLIKQLGNLYAQLDHQTYTLERREQEMREFMDTTNDQDEYLWYNWEDRTIEIDWDAIDQITDQEKYDHIKDLISEAEEIQDKMDDAEDAIIDVENQIQDLENIWRDTFIEFEERVLDAIVKMYQTVIDNYTELNDTLNETNTNILDAINKEISLQRQIRDNTKTEQEIADNEAELAYLQRDTTGGNALDILQRGKDLDEQREDYQDTLIDQAIQKLQEDNDAAAQQREKQIEIMQAQLDYQSENGEFNAYIRELMESAIDPEGHLATDSDLYRLLAEQENIDAMTATQREVWEEELDTTFKQVVAELLQQQGEAEGSYFTAVTAAFNGISDTFDKAFHGSYSQGGAHGGSKSSSSSGGGSKGKTSGNPKGKVTSEELQSLRDVAANLSKQAASAQKDYTTSTTKYNVSGAMMWGVGQAKKAAAQANKTVQDAEKLLKSAGGRENGGIVQQTGLGMLHGTISEPEYVLNARQTDAFLKLADVLPAAMNTSGQNVSNTFGATTNNIVINVDKIDSDYSVDQMVNRVKEKLFESGSYRNNNVLSLMR